MSTCRRDLECALGALLPLDVAQIGLRQAGRPQRGGRARKHLGALEMIGELDQRAWRENVEIGRSPCRLGAAGRRADQAFARGIGGDVFIDLLEDVGSALLVGDPDGEEEEDDEEDDEEEDLDGTDDIVCMGRPMEKDLENLAELSKLLNNAKY